MWFRDPDTPGGQQYLSWLVNVVDDPERGRRLEAIYASLEREINQNFPDSVRSEEHTSELQSQA